MQDRLILLGIGAAGARRPLLPTFVAFILGAVLAALLWAIGSLVTGQPMPWSYLIPYWAGWALVCTVIAALTVLRARREM